MVHIVALENILSTNNFLAEGYKKWTLGSFKPGQGITCLHVCLELESKNTILRMEALFIVNKRQLLSQNKNDRLSNSNDLLETTLKLAD